MIKQKYVVLKNGLVVALVKDDEQYGKYRPAVIGGKQYSHPLGFNLFGLNLAKDNIKKTGTALVVEGEVRPSLLFCLCFLFSFSH